jgi:hypothetical protein
MLQRYETKIADLETQLAERSNENRVLKDMNSRLNDSKVTLETENGRLQQVANTLENQHLTDVDRINQLEDLKYSSEIAAESRASEIERRYREECKALESAKFTAESGRDAAKSEVAALTQRLDDEIVARRQTETDLSIATSHIKRLEELVKS